jgi:hypothetical protein
MSTDAKQAMAAGAPVLAPVAAATAPAPIAGAAAAAPRWADLRSESLGLVFSQLEELEDRCRAACVCRSWREAATAPSLWEEVRVCLGREHDVEDVEGVLWHTRKLVLQLRWCTARGGAIQRLRFYADAASEEDLLGGDHDDKAAGRDLPRTLVAALEASGPALHALEIEDPDNWFDFYSPPVVAVWAASLRGLPSLRLDLPYLGDAWPTLSQLTALTALSACAPAQTVHGEREGAPYKRAPRCSRRLCASSACRATPQVTASRGSFPTRSPC